MDLERTRMTEQECPVEPVPASKPSGADSLFGWDQLILLALPFPLLFIARLGYILGLDSNTADKLLTSYLTPVLVLSVGTGLVAPVLVGIALLFLIVRNLRLKRPKRLVLYGIVLIGLPSLMTTIDTDYLRFRVQQRKFETLIARHPEPMPERSAFCFEFSLAQDNFYFGGANFDPFEKLIIFVSKDIAGVASPPIDSFSYPSRCPNPQSLRRIRYLEGRFYIAEARLPY
jgi:hypothetical protein